MNCDGTPAAGLGATLCALRAFVTAFECELQISIVFFFRNKKLRSVINLDRFIATIALMALLAVAVCASASAANNFPGTTISGASGSVIDTTVGMSGETGEPATIGGGGITSQWYSWTAPSTGLVVMGTCNPTTNTNTQTDTVMAVYIGGTLATLGNGTTTGTPVVSDDDGCVSTVNVNYASVLSFNATAGVIYRIQVDTYGDSTLGQFQLNWSYANLASDFTVAVVGSTATEGGATGSFTIAMNTMPSGAVTVTLGASPNCTFSPTTLNFGIASGGNNWPTAQTVTVTAINNAVVDGTRSCSPATLTANGGGFTSTALTPPTFTVFDNDALITIANTTNGSETGPTNGLFTVTQSGVSGTATVVAYTVSGTATPTTDYTALSGTVTIPAGLTTATISFPVVNDTIVEGAETVIVTLTSVTSGLGTLGATLIATNTIADNDSATISLANTANGSEIGPANGVMTVTQSAVSSTNTIMAYTVTGTATPATDYTALSGTITILAGSTTATISFSVVDDALVEGAETVVVTINSITSGQPAITLSGSVSVSNAITDNDSATISIANITDGTEAGPVAGVMRVTQTLASSTATVLSYTIGGTAVAGAHYTALSGTITISAGATTADINIAVINDSILNPGETVIVTITAKTSGQAAITLGAPLTATNTIVDNEFATFTISKAVNVANITSPQTLTYTITIVNTGNVAQHVPVITDTLSNGGALTLTSGPTLTSGDAGTVGTLDIGETWNYTATYAVNQANINNGNTITNSSTFKTTEATLLASNTVSTTITVTKQLTTFKTASTAGPVPVGMLITYTYKVTNSGNVTMSAVTVADTHNGSGPFVGPNNEAIFTDAAPLGDSTDATTNGSWDSLAPGDTLKFTATYTVTQQDVDLLQ